MLLFFFLEIVCNSLLALANGMITYATDTNAPFDYQTTASYSCSSGYGLSGGDRVRTCVGSSAEPGEWSGTAPTCEGQFLSCMHCLYRIANLLHTNLRIKCLNKMVQISTLQQSLVIVCLYKTMELYPTPQQPHLMHLVPWQPMSVTLDLV